jgi:hypothetical protein
MRRLMVLLLLCAAPAFAQDPPSDTPDQAEIEKALKADQAAKEKAGTAGPPPTAAPAPAPSAPGAAPTAAPAPTPSGLAPWATGAATVAPATGQTSMWGRVFQLLNPDIAGIVNFAGGWYSREEQTVKSGDDPAISGFNVQELELAFQAVIDPYFRADIFLAIPNLEGFEVEEAYATTMRLPANFQVKGGIFRAGFGRQNTQHLHNQEFVRRPQMNALFLGIDGLRAPGLEVNWLVPRIPWYMLLAVSAFSVGKAEPDQVLQTFGGGERHDFTYLASVRSFFSLSPATSLLLGLQYAHGKSSQSATKNEELPSTALTITTVGPTKYDNFYTHLYGVDLMLKWRPVSVAKTWAALVWQTEFFIRHIPNWRDPLGPRAQVEGGLYTQLVGQVARQWLMGVRGEILGLPEGDNVKRAYTLSGQLTWRFSEYSQLRAHGEIAFQTAPGTPRTSGAFFLQLQASIGAHGAHAF